MKKFNLVAATTILSVMVSGVATADSIRFWTTENQPERLAKQQAMADDFKKRTGHTVEVIRLRKKTLAQGQPLPLPPVTFRMSSIIHCSMSCHGRKLEFLMSKPTTMLLMRCRQTHSLPGLFQWLSLTV